MGCILLIKVHSETGHQAAKPLELLDNDKFVGMPQPQRFAKSITVLMGGCTTWEPGGSSYHNGVV